MKNAIKIFMVSFSETVTAFNEVMWGWPLIILIVSVAIFYSIELRFFQFRRFGYIAKNTFGKVLSKEVRGEGILTPFQAASTALAGTIGVGNIAGVGVALALGGPGALFWMWVVALLAAILKFAEIVLGIHYREKDPETGVYHGGFMYVVKNAFNAKKIAFIWSFLFFIQFFIGGAVQSNAIADAVFYSWGYNRLAVGAVVAVCAGLVILGGIKRIGKVAEKLVPIMAVLYFVSALGIIIINIESLPSALKTIFYTAFEGAAPVGGFAGSSVIAAMQNGFARGTFSNEAGMGTSPIAHSTAITDHPVRQGMWGVFEVFIDTIIMCTMTGLVIMVTGVLPSGEAGASLTAAAFRAGLKGRGDIIVTLSTILFAYTTITLDDFYAETGGVYCFGNKIILPFRVIFLVGIVIGAVGGLQVVWGLFDAFMAITVAINLVVIALLYKQVVNLTQDFFSREEKNKSS